MEIGEHAVDDAHFLRWIEIKLAPAGRRLMEEAKEKKWRARRCSKEWNTTAPREVARRQYEQDEQVSK